MINKVSRNYQFTEGDLIYIEDTPALIYSVYLSGFNAVMLLDGKIKVKRIDRNRIGSSWNNIQIDYHSTINLTPGMKTIIAFLTDNPSAYRSKR